ncbi:hypothetical protein [Pseudonocardia acidicola]|uniref:Uncharacterized protein n=1 Tax=Pseudonocardia acidicola TaxID=2724939 RepID=A0ABX1SGT9_9PSEU|nr:hypothetical protein [Pseudonocardia acidicola]NMH99693.1 hypothetical protein [Pseudonocardia acidicola]
MSTDRAAEVLASSTAAMLTGVRADLLETAPDEGPGAQAARENLLSRIDGLLTALHGVPCLADRPAPTEA